MSLKTSTMKKFIIPLSLFFCSSILIHAQVCTGTATIGSSSNMYSIGLGESNTIAANNDLNTVIFVHRNNAGLFGGHSGQLRYDISTDNGANWTSNLGVLNPASVNGTNAARYPNIAIYNPTGNTIPNNAYLSYLAPTVASTWSSIVTGVCKLDGTGTTENYNQAAITQTLIPRSMCKGVPGTYWAIDLVNNGATNLGYRILKGIWNNSTNDIIWSQNTLLNPPFNTAFDGTNHVSGFAIGFDPSGQKGWACLITHITQGSSSYTYYPVFYSTVNGGTTWSSPTQVNMTQFPCVTSIITSGNVPTVAFDMDLTVDMKGNPHALMCIGNGNNAYSIFYTSTHHMYDITRENGFWNAVDLGDVSGQRNTFGTAPNTLSMDMAPQSSRTDDGSKVFFTWSGSDIANVPNAPNLFGKAYDVNARSWTQMKDFTSCDPSINGTILFPKMAENVLNVLGGWELPVIYGQSTSGTDVAVPCNYLYLDSLKFTQADFVLPQCSANITFVSGDTLNLCQGSSGALIVSSPQDALLWSTGGTSPILSVNSGGWYYATVRSGCCIGKDSVFVNIIPQPTAAFINSTIALNANFTDQSGGNVTAWNWNFGDGTTDNSQNPIHTYDFPGTYTVCLIVNNGCTDTICQTVSVSCTIPNANFTSVVGNGGSVVFTNTTTPTADNYSWDFGDGTTSTLENPTHVYTTSGNYTVCLLITDTCGTDSLCALISVDVFASLEGLVNGSFAVYPNPTTGMIKITATNLPQNNWELTLVNSLGQILLQKKKTESSLNENIALTEFANGIYFLKVKSAEQSAEFRIIKE